MAVKTREVLRTKTRRYTAEEMLGLTVKPSDNALLVGRHLTCPACEKVQDVLSYKPLEWSEKYAEQVVAPMICPNCKHVFALRP